MSTIHEVYLKNLCYLLTVTEEVIQCNCGTLRVFEVVWSLHENKQKSQANIDTL